MARIVLDLPDRFPFATELDVRVTDLNYGRHLGNDALLALVHEARYRYLRSLGVSELDVDGLALLLADAALVYRAEAFAGDRLRFELAFADLRRVSCDLLYRVTRPADAALVAECKTGLVFLDPSTRRPAPVPAVIRRAAGAG